MFKNVYEKVLLWTSMERAIEIKQIVRENEGIDLFGYARMMYFADQKTFELIYGKYGSYFGGAYIPEIKNINDVTEEDWKDKEIAGTVKARFNYLLEELEKRFPNPNPFDSSKVPEQYYLEAIDELLKS